MDSCSSGKGRDDKAFVGPSRFHPEPYTSVVTMGTPWFWTVFSADLLVDIFVGLMTRACRDEKFG